MLARLRVLKAEVSFVGGESLRRAPLIVLFILFSAGLDLLAVALVAPFVSLLMGKNAAMALFPDWLLRILGDDPVGTLGIALVIVFTGKALATFQLQGTITRMSESIRAELMTRLLSAYQHRPYRFHLDNSSTELTNRLVWYTQAFSTGFVGAGARLISDCMVFIALGTLIALANMLALLLLLIVLSIVFTIVLFYIRNRASKLNQATAAMTAEVMHSANQAIGGLREVRILGCEEYFLARLSKAGRGLVDASAHLAVISLIPRQAVELAMIVFLVALVFFSRMDGVSGAALLPLLGLIGAAGLRLMPASTALLTGINQVRSNRFVVGVLARDLALEKTVTRPSANSSADQRPEIGPLNSRPLSSGPLSSMQMTSTPDAMQAQGFQSLSAEAITFSYSADRNTIFESLSFEINAGETVALIGPSGAGKSTLADLLLGFLDPTAGRILVNGKDLRGAHRDWQSMVAYIPQQSYLIDDTLRRNVALGVADAEIDDKKVLAALQDAQLGQVLRDLASGLDTQLGERGVRFSGGQRQRVSIARALYHDREFLVLDEATSALDEETEREIVETIRSLAGKKTILLISHRESTLAVANRTIAIKPLQKANSPK